MKPCVCLEDPTTIEECQECCEHDFDPDEGYICLNCGLEGDPCDYYDEDYGQER